MGVEPTRPIEHNVLSVACLPFHHRGISFLLLVAQGRIELPRIVVMSNVPSHLATERKWIQWESPHLTTNFHVSYQR